MTTLTRRTLAEYVSSQLVAGKVEVIDELAAYLVESRRTKEMRLLVRDIESALARRGILVAHVASAHALDEPTRASVRQLLHQHFDADALHLQETVTPKLLGGVTVAAADRELDASVKRRIHQLRSVKV